MTNEVDTAAVEKVYSHHRWVCEQLLRLYEAQVARRERIQRQATGFFLVLPLVLGLTADFRGEAPAEPASKWLFVARCACLVLFLAALCCWFTVIRVGAYATPSTDLFVGPPETAGRSIEERVEWLRNSLVLVVNEAEEDGTRLGKRRQVSQWLSLAGLLGAFVVLGLEWLA